jgi:hypothetical protein
LPGALYSWSPRRSCSRFRSRPWAEARIKTAPAKRSASVSVWADVTTVRRLGCDGGHRRAAGSRSRCRRRFRACRCDAGSLGREHVLDASVQGTRLCARPGSGLGEAIARPPARLLTKFDARVSHPT